MNGVTANPTPTAPTAEVARVNMRRLPLFIFCSLMDIPQIEPAGQDKLDTFESWQSAFGIKK
jgi:hypothetical protein